MEKLRIVLASDWYWPRKGGVETSIHNIARILLRRGHEPIIVTHQYKNYKSYNNPVEDHDGITVVRFKVPLRANSDDVTTSVKAAVFLHDFLKHNAVDLVHGHSLVSPFAHMAVHVAKALLGIPTLATHHSLLYGEVNFRQRMLLKIATMKADVLSAVSTVSAEDARRLLNREVIVTHNCIMLDEWRDTDPLDLEGDPTVLLVSRLIPRKRPLLALKAFAELVKQIPDARLYIIGSGPEEELIRMEAEKIGIYRKIVLTGSLEHDEVKKYMASGDILLLPSDREAFPMAALEAQAFGLPVIGLETTGVRDIIDDGINGFLARSDEDFIRKVVQLGSNYQLRRSMSNEAIKKIELFDCDKVYSLEYSNAYKLALESCSKEKRYLLYKLFRLLKADPVKPGEWCSGRRDKYASVPPKRSGVPYIRRRARRSTIPVFQHQGY